MAIKWLYDLVGYVPEVGEQDVVVFFWYRRDVFTTSELDWALISGPNKHEMPGSTRVCCMDQSLSACLIEPCLMESYTQLTISSSKGIF